MRRQIPVLLVLPWLAGACQPAPIEQRPDRVPASRSASSPGPVPPRLAPAPSNTAAPASIRPHASPEDAAPEQAAQVKLAVEGKGLRLVRFGTGSTTPLAFGLSREAVLAPLEKLRGPAGQGVNPECGSEYADWADGLGLNFKGGKFVGWALDGRSAGAITTMAGLGIGSTRDTLGAYDYKVVRTSLGSEFSAGDLHGLLNSAARDAKVTNLWAGEVCIAR